MAWGMGMGKAAWAPNHPCMAPLAHLVPRELRALGPVFAMTIEDTKESLLHVTPELRMRA